LSEYLLVRRLLVKQLVAADDRERRRQVRALLAIPAVAAVGPGKAFQVIRERLAPRLAAARLLSRRTPRQNGRESGGGGSFQHITAGMTRHQICLSSGPQGSELFCQNFRRQRNSINGQVF